MNNKELNKAIGFEMRTQRLIRRMTIEYVAEKMGIASKNTISRWELGQKNITVSDLKAYCDVIGCDWMALLRKVS